MRPGSCEPSSRVTWGGGDRDARLNTVTTPRSTRIQYHLDVRWLVFLVLAAACGNKGPTSPPDSRLVELERVLRQGGRDVVRSAAAEYRELRAEHPDALRTVADAYARLGDEAAEFETVRTLVVRGQGMSEDKARALRLALELELVDETMYRTGLTWLEEMLNHEPYCATFALLVDWTNGRPEHRETLDRGLAGCPRDQERARWFALRAARSDSAEDACNAVVHGHHQLAERCLESETLGWRVGVARAMREGRVYEHLIPARSAPDVTVFVLRMYAASPDVPRDEACAALARAQEMEISWLPRAGHEAAIAARYDALRKQRGCE
jgi:hypothetical protein